MTIPDNITRLASQEAELRAQSLAAIAADKVMGDHLDVLEASMSSLMDHIQGRPDRSQAELIIQRLGIRLFNSLGSGLGQALTGYYQQGFDAIRDVVELQFLFDDFSDDVEKPVRWGTLSRRDRDRAFRPSEVHKRLDARYKHTGDGRRRAYQLLSTMASHASPDGFALITPKDNLSVIGPFFERRFLEAFMAEIARHAVGASVNFGALLPAQTTAEWAAKHVYAQRAGQWAETYLGVEVARGITGSGS